MYILTDVTTAEWDNYVGFKQRHGAFDTVQWKWIMLTHSQPSQRVNQYPSCHQRYFG